MFATIRNAWKIPELRKKLLFTLFVLLLFRLGAQIPVPNVNVDALQAYFNGQLSGTILGLYNAMSGSAFSQATTFALGIQPYINASIIIQLLCVAIPYLERLSKEGGEEGKKKLERITRFTTMGSGSADGLGLLPDAEERCQRHPDRHRFPVRSGHCPDLHRRFLPGYVAG